MNDITIVVLQSQTVCPLHPAGNVKHRVVTYYTCSRKRVQIASGNTHFIAVKCFGTNKSEHFNLTLASSSSSCSGETLPRWWNVVKKKQNLLPLTFPVNKLRVLKQAFATTSSRVWRCLPLRKQRKENTFEPRSSGAVSGKRSGWPRSTRPANALLARSLPRQTSAPSFVH